MAPGEAAEGTGQNYRSNAHSCGDDFRRARFFEAEAFEAGSSKWEIISRSISSPWVELGGLSFTASALGVCTG